MTVRRSFASTALLAVAAGLGLSACVTAPAYDPYPYHVVEPPPVSVGVVTTGTYYEAGYPVVVAPRPVYVGGTTVYRTGVPVVASTGVYGRPAPVYRRPEFRASPPLARTTVYGAPPPVYAPPQVYAPPRVTPVAPSPVAQWRGAGRDGQGWGHQGRHEGHAVPQAYAPPMARGGPVRGPARESAAPRVHHDGPRHDGGHR